MKMTKVQILWFYAVLKFHFVESVIILSKFIFHCFHNVNVFLFSLYKIKWGIVAT